MSPPSPRFSTEQPLRRILIVRLSAHGDVIHTLPLLSALKQQWPDATIGWLTETSALPLLENHPLIDHLHVAHRKRWLDALKKPSQWPQTLREIRIFLNSIQAQRYEVSLDVQGLLKSALWPWLAKIPFRLGYKATREQADRFYTDTLPPMIIRDGSVSAVQRYLDFVPALGGKPVSTPTFILPPVPKASQAKADAWLAEALGRKNATTPPENEPTNIKSANTKGMFPFVALAPFTRWPSKHWIMDYWPQLIDSLVAIGVCPILLGGTGDQPATERLLKALSPDMQSAVLNLVGQTDWPELQALIRQCDLLIGLDSAPLHLADAVGTRVIALFGPTALGRTGPIGSQHQLLTTSLSCQPCFERVCPIKTHACMTQLTPDLVTARARSMLFPPALPSVSAS